MAKKSVRRSQRKLTDKEKTRLRSVRQQVEEDEEDILRRGREVFAEHEEAVARTIGDLKRARQSQGLTLQEGLTDVHRDEVAIKRDMVRRAKKVIAIVDSSKWGRVGFASFASIDELDCVITDRDAPADMVNALEASGIQVIVA